MANYRENLLIQKQEERKWILILANTAIWLYNYFWVVYLLWINTT